MNPYTVVVLRNGVVVESVNCYSGHEAYNTAYALRQRYPVAEGYTVDW